MQMAAGMRMASSVPCTDAPTAEQESAAVNLVDTSGKGRAEIPEPSRRQGSRLPADHAAGSAGGPLPEQDPSGQCLCRQLLAHPYRGP
jgi:hypothetical protein